MRDTITCARPVVTLTASSSEAGVYQWTGPGNFVANNTLEVSVNMPGTYYFQATYADGCSLVDSTIVSVDTLRPVALGGPDTTLNCIRTAVTLSGMVPAGTAVQWTNTDGEFLSETNSLTVNQPGNFLFTVINPENGCSTTDTIIVRADTIPPTATIQTNAGATLDCNTTNLTLSTTPAPGINYSWNVAGDIITATDITVSIAASYMLTATDTLTGCSDRDSIVINDLEALPFIQILPPVALSCNTQRVTIDGSASQQGPDISYLWLDENFNPISGETGPTLTVMAPGTYYLRLEDAASGCENTDTVTIAERLTFPEISLPDTIILPCLETSTNLLATIDADPGTVNVLWSSSSGQIVSGAASLMPTISGLGLYRLRVEDIDTGCTSVDSVFVTNNQNVPSEITFAVEPERCAGENNGTFTAISVSGGTGPISYALNGSSNLTGFFGELSPGSYLLSISDVNGCGFDTLFTVAAADPILLELPPTLTLEENQRSQLTGISNIEEQALARIQWTPATAVDCSFCLTTTLTARESQNLRLTITDINGCTATAATQLIVNSLPEIYIPNAFSPNGDGQNDRFTLFANQRVEEVETVIIADRWGEIVFQQNSFPPGAEDFGWDGSFRGEPLNPGVFVYFLRVRLQSGEIRTFKGDLLLMR